jgi:small subunit ribosomal protein S9
MVKKSSKIKFFQGIGKRKSAVALVRLYPLKSGAKLTINSILMKKGDFYVNKKQLSESFQSEIYKKIIIKPLILTDSQDIFAVSVYVRGGGKRGQANAISHGITKALINFDSEKNKAVLKKNRLLTRDPRIKERRKVGTGGKARRKKQSPKR